MPHRAKSAAIALVTGVCLGIGWTATPPLQASEPVAPAETPTPTPAAPPAVGPGGFEHLRLPTLPPPPPPLPPPAPEPPVPAAVPVARAVVRAPAPVDAPPPPLPPPTGTGIWAVVVGVDDYPGESNDLQGAVTDARDAEAALAAFAGPAEQRRVLIGASATGAAVRDALQWLVANAGPDATPVVYLAGHVRRAGPGRQAFRAADGRLVTDAEMARILDGLHAPRLWLAVAGCYGAGFDEVVRNRPGRILTAASGADEIAYENTGLKRSYLGEYMVVRAMLRDGLSSVRSAFAAADAALAHDYPHRRPVLVDGGGEVDLRS